MLAWFDAARNHCFPERPQILIEAELHQPAQAVLDLVRILRALRAAARKHDLIRNGIEKARRAWPEHVPVMDMEFSIPIVARLLHPRLAVRIQRNKDAALRQDALDP